MVASSSWSGWPTLISYIHIWYFDILRAFHHITFSLENSYGAEQQKRKKCLPLSWPFDILLQCVVVCIWIHKSQLNSKAKGNRSNTNKYRNPFYFLQHLAIQYYNSTVEMYTPDVYDNKSKSRKWASHPISKSQIQVDSQLPVTLKNKVTQRFCIIISFWVMMKWSNKEVEETIWE